MKRLLLLMVAVCLLALGEATALAVKTPAPCVKFQGYDREACSVTVRFIRGYFQDNYPAICYMVTNRFMFKWSGGWNVCLTTPKGPGEAPPLIRVPKVIAAKRQASVWIAVPSGQRGLWCLVRVRGAFKIDDSLPAGLKCRPDPLSV